MELTSNPKIDDCESVDLENVCDWDKSQPFAEWLKIPVIPDKFVDMERQNYYLQDPNDKGKLDKEDRQEKSL